MSIGKALARNKTRNKSKIDCKTMKIGKGLNIPMQYEVEKGVENAKSIKVTCKDVEGNDCKEELPIYTNNTPDEILLILLEEALAMGERFDWFVDVKNKPNPKARLTFQHFGRALKAVPHRKWAKLIKNQRKFTKAGF